MRRPRRTFQFLAKKGFGSGAVLREFFIGFCWRSGHFQPDDPECKGHHNDHSPQQAFSGQKLIILREGCEDEHNRRSNPPGEACYTQCCPNLRQSHSPSAIRERNAPGTSSMTQKYMCPPPRLSRSVGLPNNQIEEGNVAAASGTGRMGFCPKGHTTGSRRRQPDGKRELLCREDNPPVALHARLPTVSPVGDCSLAPSFTPAK